MNTVLIVDDHALFREGLRNIIGRWEGFQVLGEAKNGQEAIRLAHELMPDIILMDITMPVMGGIEATRRIMREIPSSLVVMLTMSEEEENLFEAVKSGARGYVLKDTPSPILRQKLLGVTRGEAPLSGIMASKILKEFNRLNEIPEPAYKDSREPLTSREQQVLELVVQGLTNPEISARLFLSENTVKKYLHNILEKLHLNNRVEAAIYALREGLVDQ